VRAVLIAFAFLRNSAVTEHHAGAAPLQPSLAGLAK
jgi:hypothetical protein